MPHHSKILQAVLCSLMLATPCLGAEQERVWSQHDGLRYEIYYSEYKEGEWEQPEKLTGNNANNLHPAFAIAPNGNRWVFWSVVRSDGDGISIQYLVARNGEWSKPQPVEMKEISSAVTPSVLIDKQGTVCNQL